MEGFVTKRGHLIKSWKVRWFILDGGEIRYYTDKTLQTLKGRYILRKESIVSYHADMGLNKNVILIFTTSHPFRKRALYFSCDGAESKEAWIAAINAQLEALRTGVMVPVAAPNILENLSSRINNNISNTISTVLSTCTPGNEQPHTTDADIEELLKGRPVARNARLERSISIDSSDSRTPSQKPVRPLSSSKRSSLKTTTVKQSAGDSEENGYTAADYDSSDTDGSANEEYIRTNDRERQDTREGREKSGSDAPRARQGSTGQGSAQSAAFLATEALSSPILLKKHDAVGSGGGGSSSIASSTASGQVGKNNHAGVEDAFLPRVSTIVAQRKLNFNNNYSSTSSTSSMKPAAKQASPAGKGQGSPLPASEGAGVAREKPTSFTTKVSTSAVNTSANAACSSSKSKNGGVERAAPTVSAAEGTDGKATVSATAVSGADPDCSWIEVRLLGTNFDA
jgi:hypothetical protein